MKHTKQLVLSAVFAALTAASAFLRIPAGGTYVTLPVLFVVLSGMLLGPGWGAMSQLVYVALGLLGLPIFTEGGGLSYVLKPTFGFLLSYIPAAFLVGLIVQKWGSALWKLLLAGLAGVVVFYAVALPYVYLIQNLYLGNPLPVSKLMMGYCVIFLPFDAAKVLAAALLSARLLPIVRKLGKF